MPTTASLKKNVPLGPEAVIQVWRVSIGAGDTTANWKTGLSNVSAVVPITQTDQSVGGAIPNSNNGTENSVLGDAFIGGCANSTIMDVIVIGN